MPILTCIIARRRRGLSTAAIAFILIALVAGFAGGYMLAKRATPSAPAETVTASNTAVSSDAAPVSPAAVDEQLDEGPVKPPAPIIFDPPVMDLGFVQPGAVVTASTLIVNPTAEPLRIIASRPSCSCTSVDLSDVIIPAGGSVPLEATFTAEQRLGRKTAAVRVLIEGDYAVAQVNLEATVAETVFAEPGVIRANLEDPDTGALIQTGTVTISAQDDEPFRITAVNDAPPVYADGTTSNMPRVSHELIWDVTGYGSDCLDEDGEYMNRWWVVETDHPDTPMLDLQIRHECTILSAAERPNAMRQWFFGEQRVRAGRLAPGQEVDISIPIKWLRTANADENFVLAVSDDTEELTAELLGVERIAEREARADIRITLAPDFTGLLRGVIRIVSNDRQQAPFEVIARVQ